MYARLILSTLGPGTRSIADKITGPQDAAMCAQRGFKAVTYLGNDEVGQYGALVLWESKEDAEAAFEVLFPQLQKAIGDLEKEPPVTTLFEVLEPPA